MKSEKEIKIGFEIERVDGYDGKLKKGIVTKIEENNKGDKLLSVTNFKTRFWFDKQDLTGRVIISIEEYMKMWNRSDDCPICRDKDMDKIYGYS